MKLLVDVNVNYVKGMMVNSVIANALDAVRDPGLPPTHKTPPIHNYEHRRDGSLQWLSVHIDTHTLYSIMKPLDHMVAVSATNKQF